MEKETHDKAGREWAKLSALKAGDWIELDGGFTCQGACEVLIQADDTGQLWFGCAKGKHYLDGQADNGDHLVGIYHSTTTSPQAIRGRER